MADTENGSVFDDVVSGLNDAIRYESGGTPTSTRTRRVTIAPVPRYEASTIKSIRRELGLSQVAFAQALGVSPKTVEAWEAGTNVPQGPAQRMLELLQKEHDLLERHHIIQA